MGLGLLVIRLAVGLTLAAHGSQKLLGWFDGPGPEKAGKMMHKLGFRPGPRHARLAGASEMAGGTLLALGFVTPVAAAIIVGTMFVAGASAHAQKGFFLTSGGYEYTFMLGVTAWALAITGPGALALDSLWPIALHGAVYATLALIVGLGAGAVMLAARQTDDDDETAVTETSERDVTRSTRIEGGRDSAAQPTNQA
ncbi:MAG: putative oxidoreductase [Actinomycetota bacterium]|jgi:putative oxidoreductase|nr:putative oxidoreductase [Actinomycetota bacterium]